MKRNNVFGIKNDVYTYTGKYFNTREEARHFKRISDRIYYDSKIKKYYLKRIDQRFW